MFAPFAFMGSGSAAPPAVTIVTDQLRLYVNANDVTSYPGSGSTWFDLSGAGRNLNLDATPTFDGSGTPKYFDFTDGTDAATYRPGGTLSPVTSQGDTYTICMFMTYYNVSATFRTIVRAISGGGGADFIMVNTGTNNLGTYDTVFRTLGVNIVTDIPSYDSQFNYQVWTVDDGAVGDDVFFYLNAASGSAEGSNNFPLRNDGPGIFGNQETGGQPGAQIAAILVYDKVLSTAEIGQNYEALKTSMGL